MKWRGFQGRGELIFLYQLMLESMKLFEDSNVVHTQVYIQSTPCWLMGHNWIWHNTAFIPPIGVVTHLSPSHIDSQGFRFKLGLLLSHVCGRCYDMLEP